MTERLTREELEARVKRWEEEIRKFTDIRGSVPIPMYKPAPIAIRVDDLAAHLAWHYDPPEVRT